MPIDLPQSDLSRAKATEADHSWPDAVKIQLYWTDKHGRPSIRTEVISANEFFGLGPFGAPLEGAALIARIERMRRDGPPKVSRRRR